MNWSGVRASGSADRSASAPSRPVAASDPPITVTRPPRTATFGERRVHQLAHRTVRPDGHDRHVRLGEDERPVREVGGRIRLGEEAHRLLELQRELHGRRQVVAPARRPARGRPRPGPPRPSAPDRRATGACRSACRAARRRSRARPSARSLDGRTAATSAATTVSSATYVFVAGTASSRPAWQRSCHAAAAANGERASFVIATVSAPAARAARTTATMSGLCPDCEMARTRPPRPGHRRVVDRGDGWLGQPGRQAEVRLEQVLRVDRRVVGGAAPGDHHPARALAADGIGHRAELAVGRGNDPLDRGGDLADLSAHPRACGRRRAHETAVKRGRYGRFASSNASSSGPTSPIR